MNIHRHANLPVMDVKLVSHIMGGKQAQSVQGGVLAMILGPHKEKVTGNRRKPHNVELHDCTPHQPLIA